MRNSETPEIREVKSNEELVAAVAAANDKDTIKLTDNITGDITLTKLVNLDLNGKTLTGNVSITSETVGTLNIKAGTITGDLTVDAKNATVNNEATVSGTIKITDVSSNTWNELVSGNKLEFNAEGKTLKIADEVTVGALTINKNATVISSKAVQAVVAKDVKVTVKANKDAKGEEFTGTEDGGNITLDPEAPVVPTIVSIKKVKVEQGAELPADVTAVMSNDKEVEIAATWADTVKTDTVGTSTAKVTVEGKEYDVELEVTAKPNQDQAAPEGLTGKAPTTADGKDGKIIGLVAETSYEYKLKGSKDEFTKLTSETGLAAGTYEVRLAAKDGFNAGAV